MVLDHQSRQPQRLRGDRIQMVKHSLIALSCRSLREIYSVSFNIRSQTRPENIQFDVCLVGMAYLVKRGVFAYSTWDEIFASNDSIIKIKDEFLEEPVFLAIGPGGRQLSKGPMLSSSMTRIYRTTAERVGIRKRPR
jgi:hypothetical protein